MISFLKTSELAARWGVTTGHLRNLRTAGRGPRWTRPGRFVLYDLKDVLEHEASGQGSQLKCVRCQVLARQASRSASAITTLEGNVRNLQGEIGMHKRMNRVILAELTAAQERLKRAD